MSYQTFFFASHNNLCATHWTQTTTWFIYTQQRSWGLLSITLHVSVHNDHTLATALRYELSLYTQTMWTIQLVFWKANLWTHTSLYHECVCRQIIPLLLWQHFRRAHFSHTEDKKRKSTCRQRRHPFILIPNQLHRRSRNYPGKWRERSRFFWCVCSQMYTWVNV